MPTEQEIETIIGLWNQDKTYGEIANAINGPKSTVQGWIQNLIKKDVIKPRTESVRTNTKKATEARRTYDKARRLELNDRLFTRLEEFLDSQVTTREYKDLMVSYGILEDKRSLLEPIVPVPVRTKLDDLIEAMVDASDIPPSAQTMGRISPLPEDPSDTDVRVSQERQDGNPAVLRSEGS